MAAKLINDQGDVIFEFENDAIMCSRLLGLISQAKYGEELRPAYTLSLEINAFAHAILKHAQDIGMKGFENANGYYPSPPQGVTWYPRPSWCHAVDRMIFENAPDLKWWELSREDKEEIVQRAFYPHKLSAEVIEDSVDNIDFWISRYRQGNN